MRWQKRNRLGDERKTRQVADERPHSTTRLRDRSHVHRLAGLELRGAELVDEDERPDHGPPWRGQRPTHAEGAKIMRDRRYRLQDRHGVILPVRGP